MASSDIKYIKDFKDFKDFFHNTIFTLIIYIIKKTKTSKDHNKKSVELNINHNKQNNCNTEPIIRKQSDKDK